MRLFRFTFQNEAKWILILSLSPVVLGCLVLAVIWLFRLH